MVFDSCLEKQNRLKAIFIPLSPEEKYQKIIEMGRALAPLNPDSKTPETRIDGCQSLLFLETRHEDGKLYFNADSEALISKGLAALLIAAYSGEAPEVISECPPAFIKEIGLHLALSPSRSSGLIHLYHRMRKEALKDLAKI